MISVIAQKLNIYPGDGKNPYARTGQLSTYHLKKAGAKGALLGHSEVGESPEQINKKLLALTQAGMLRNIILLGDRWEDLGKPWEELNEAGKQHVEDVVKEKLTLIIAGIDTEILRTSVFAYEPAWSITGSGKNDVPPASAEQIERITGMLASLLPQTRVIYGGSMKSQRTGEIMALPSIHGFIVGSAGTHSSEAEMLAQSVKAGKKNHMPVVALNWKAYELQEPYETFIDILKPYEIDCDIYLAPAATDLAALSEKLKAQRVK